MVKLAGTLGIFRGHNRSIKAILISEILFGTAIAWFALYRPVYMVALGLTKIQVGIVSAVLLGTQVVAAVLGGLAATRLGNKRAMQLFDTFAWLTSILLWLTARGFWSFIVAALFNGLYYGAIPNWSAIVAGNAPRERRPTVYSLIHLTFLGSGLFAPFAGFLVARFGVIPGNRIIYACGFVIVGAAITVRQLFVEEAKLDERPVLPGDNIPQQEGYSGALQLFSRDRRVLSLLVAFGLTSFSYIIWGNYSALYLTEGVGLGIPAAAISSLPVVNSISMALMLLFVIPNIRERNHNKALIIGSATMPIALIIFLLAPKQVFWPILLFSFLNAGGNAMYEPLRASLQANLISPRLLASVISLGSTMVLLSSIPVGPIAGKLFVTNPRYPFYVMLALQSSVALLMWFISAHSKKHYKKEITIH